MLVNLITGSNFGYIEGAETSGLPLRQALLHALCFTRHHPRTPTSKDNFKRGNNYAHISTLPKLTYQYTCQRKIVDMQACCGTFRIKDVNNKDLETSCKATTANKNNTVKQLNNIQNILGT